MDEEYDLLDFAPSGFYLQSHKLTTEKHKRKKSDSWRENSTVEVHHHVMLRDDGSWVAIPRRIPSECNAPISEMLSQTASMPYTPGFYVCERSS
jgi:hypothetical protein